ncbi:MAG: glycosyltransferase family 4 protein [Chitinophagaceae bacterium]
MPAPLKILMVNWIWHRVAGEWTYIDNLQSLYKRYGHEVIPFSMKHPKNVDAHGYEQYFIDTINYTELNKNKSLNNSIRAVSKTIYSREAKIKLRQLLLHCKIDVVHLHDVNHYLTPSILPILKEHNIPILWTLHDYTLICPESTFVSGGRICENCKGGNFYHCALQRCKKGSLLASILAAAENTVHTYTKAFKYVDYFLCPSAFLLNKFRAFNFYPDKLVLSNLCCEMNPMPEKKAGQPYIIYAGRLAKTKGILTLLNAMKGVPVQLLIAGDGPEAATINKFITDNQLSHITMLGFTAKEPLYDLVQNAVCLVCPSEYYENFPYTVIEAMLLKTPVIAAAIGGIPELVIHQETGLLFEPFSSRALQAQILRLLHDSDLQLSLAKKAYSQTAGMVNYQQHYNILKNVFGRVGLAL